MFSRPNHWLCASSSFLAQTEGCLSKMTTYVAIAQIVVENSYIFGKHIFSWYPLCLTGNNLYGAINLVWWEWNALFNQLGRNFGSYGWKIVKFQQENDQNDPLRKLKCQILSWYPPLYGRKWFIWCYKFGLVRMKYII